MTQINNKILIVGIAMIDTQVMLDKLPQRGENLFAKNIDTSIGGVAYNIACALRNMDCDYDLYVPINDSIENRIDKDLNVHKISSSEVPSCIIFITPDGERTMITVGKEYFKRAWLDKIDTSLYGAVYISGYELVESGRFFVDWLTAWKEKNKDLVIYFAPGPVVQQISEAVMDGLMSLSPIVHLSKIESFLMTGKLGIESAANAISKRSNNVVVITDGEHGAGIKTDAFYMVPSDPVIPTDTTGAGDNHIATIIAKRQKGAEWLDAVKFANKVSAKIVTSDGSNVSREEFEKWGFEFAANTIQA